MRPELFSRPRFSDALVRQYLFPQALGGAMLSVDRPEYLYQANDTSTPVTGYGQPVGRILDQSGKGTHFGQSTSTSRPMRQQDAGGFSYMQVRTDDFLQSLASVDYSAAAYVTTVFALVRQSSVATGRLVFETSTNSGAANGAVGSFFTSGNGLVGQSRGTSLSQAALPSGQVPPQGQKGVYTHVASIADDVSTLAVGPSSASSPTDQGAGGYIAAPEYLFARAGTSMFADLDFYAMLQIATAQPLTPQQLQVAQLWCASKMGVKP